VDVAEVAGDGFHREVLGGGLQLLDVVHRTDEVAGKRGTVRCGGARPLRELATLFVVDMGRGLVRAAGYCGAKWRERACWLAPSWNGSAPACLEMCGSRALGVAAVGRRLDKLWRSYLWVARSGAWVFAARALWHVDCSERLRARWSEALGGA
jgi:hypothetical protein